VKEFAAQRRLANVKCLPYQPIDLLAASLSAADLHLVVMGTKFVGTIHPCKLYNVLRVGAPVLYIGPQPSHISEILAAIAPRHWCAYVEPGDIDATIRAIQDCQQHPRQERTIPAVCDDFSQSRLVPRFISVLQQQLVPQQEKSTRLEGKADAASAVSVVQK
jgi:hypothetical protein